jgi:hypothetical protein
MRKYCCNLFALDGYPFFQEITFKDNGIPQKVRKSQILSVEFPEFRRDKHRCPFASVPPK